MRRLGMLVFMFLLAPVADSEAAEDIASCRAISDDGERLACYDQLFAEPADTTALVDAEQLESKEDRVKPEPVEMAATVTQIKKPKGRAATLTLDNGQVWSQVSFRYVRLREGDQITIRSSRFGGYILTNERGVTMRVRRLK